MRLVNVHTVQLEEFLDNRIPKYAILSHTWEDQEVLFDEFIAINPALNEDDERFTPGYAKIFNFCRFADARGYDYVWIDTCCIDKRSSAELSEAINSMCLWYEQADRCFAYMCDVTSVSDKDQFFGSRWWTRGWTLQELLAPANVIFLTKEWVVINDKRSLAEEIGSAKGIVVRALQGIDAARRESVAARMSWAAGRVTTRVEDRAYSLLGLFDCQMSLLYGEGDKAFIRLQEEVLRRTNDQSILAWGIGTSFSTFVSGERGETPYLVFRDFSEYEECNTGVFASSPDDFKGSEDIITTDRSSFYGTRTDVDGLGVNVKLPVIACHHKDPHRQLIWDSYVAFLACKRASRQGSYIGIILWRPHMLYHPQSYLRMKRLAFREHGGQRFSSTFDLDARLIAWSHVSDLALLKTPTRHRWDEERPMNKVTLIVEIPKLLEIGVDVTASTACNLTTISDPQDVKRICFDGTFRDILSGTLPQRATRKELVDFSLHLRALEPDNSLERWSIDLTRHTPDQITIEIWFTAGGDNEPQSIARRLFLSREMVVLYVKTPKDSAIGEFEINVDELDGFPTRHIRFGLAEIESDT